MEKRERERERRRWKGGGHKLTSPACPRPARLFNPTTHSGVVYPPPIPLVRPERCRRAATRTGVAPGVTTSSWPKNGRNWVMGRAAARGVDRTATRGWGGILPGAQRRSGAAPSPALARARAGQHAGGVVYRVRPALRPAGQQRRSPRTFSCCPGPRPPSYRAPRVPPRRASASG